jgi:hypothetical protein
LLGLKPVLTLGKILYDEIETFNGNGIKIIINSELTQLEAPCSTRILDHIQCFVLNKGTIKVLFLNVNPGQKRGIKRIGGCCLNLL